MKTDNVSANLNIRLLCLYLEVPSFLTLYFVTYVTVELALQ